MRSTLAFICRFTNCKLYVWYSYRSSQRGYRASQHGTKTWQHVIGHCLSYTLWTYHITFPITNTSEHPRPTSEDCVGLALLFCGPLLVYILLVIVLSVFSFTASDYLFGKGRPTSLAAPVAIPNIQLAISKPTNKCQCASHYLLHTL
jgi:hypothetical protein